MFNSAQGCFHSYILWMGLTISSFLMKMYRTGLFALKMRSNSSPFFSYIFTIAFKEAKVGFNNVTSSTSYCEPNVGYQQKNEISTIKSAQRCSHVHNKELKSIGGINPPWWAHLADGNCPGKQPSFPHSEISLPTISSTKRMMQTGTFLCQNIWKSLSNLTLWTALLTSRRQQ